MPASVAVRIGQAALHFFLVAGQSQAKGTSQAGDVNEAPVVPAGRGLELTAPSTFTQMDEPMQWNSDTGRGGGWSAFCVRYFALTGHQPVIMNRGWSGSAQIPAAGAADNNWATGSSSNRLATTRTAVDQALVALAARPEGFVFRGILWDQGGQEGIGIDLGTPGVTKAAYKTGFEATAAQFRAWYGATLPIFIFRLGRELSADTAGWAAIRDAQDEEAAADPNTWMAFTGGVGFPDRGLQWDAYHYKMAGYNEYGDMGAQAVVAAIGAG